MPFIRGCGRRPHLRVAQCSTRLIVCKIDSVKKKSDSMQNYRLDRVPRSTHYSYYLLTDSTLFELIIQPSFTHANHVLGNPHTLSSSTLVSMWLCICEWHLWTIIVAVHLQYISLYSWSMSSVNHVTTSIQSWLTHRPGLTAHGCLPNRPGENLHILLKSNLT